MADYVDGFVIPVPRKNLAAYRRGAQKAGKIWLDHGALAVREFVADDVKPGKLTSFPQAVSLKADETVVLAWIVYKSRKHRDAVNAKVIKDPRMAHDHSEGNTFDGRRLIYGGFKQIVTL